MKRSPYLGKIAGGVATIVSAAAVLDASGQLPIISDVVGKVSPKWGATIAIIASVCGWLARAPIGKRP